VFFVYVMYIVFDFGGGGGGAGGQPGAGGAPLCYRAASSGPEERQAHHEGAP
jgi:hypothetical protein